jgi:O-antigen ligase
VIGRKSPSVTSAAPPAWAALEPAGSSPYAGALKWIALAAVAFLAFLAGSAMDVTILIMALGLFNVAVVVFLLLRRDISWGFLFYLTSVIFFQTGFWIRLPAFPDLYPARIAAILLYLFFLIQILVGMRKVPPLGRVEKTMLIFLTVLFISVITSGQRPRWILLMNGYVYPYLFYYFARSVIKTESQIRIVLGYLAILGIYLGIMGIFEKMKWYGLVFPKIIVDQTVRDEGLTRLGFRVRGIFLHPAILGTVMTMGFFASWYMLSRLRGMTPLITRLVLLAVTPPTIFFTQTRSVYLGFLAALCVGAIWSRMLRPLCVGLILAGMVGAFLNWDNLGSEDRDVGGLATTNTIESRIALFYEALETFIDHPLFGCGFMNFGEIAIEYRRPRDVPFFGHIDLGLGTEAVPHNIFLTVFAEQGLLGIVPYFLIYFFLFRASLRAYRDLPRTGMVSREFVVCVWCAIVGYFANAMLLEMRYFEYVNVLFFFLLGSMVGMHERYLAGQAISEEAAPAPRPRAIPWSSRVAGAGAGGRP